MKTSLVFRESLLLGKSIDRKKLDKIKKNLRKKPFFSGVFLIVTSRNEIDQLEIFDARQLIQPVLQRMNYDVVGIAASREEAIEVVEELVQKCMEVRGDCRLKEYLG